MKSENVLKPIAWVFIAALGVYVAAYMAIEHRRQRNGPWEVLFAQDAAGVPALVINQPELGITNVQITFPGAALPDQFTATNVVFDEPRPVPFPTPFGRCIFIDTTFLPGTVVIELFGHEVQLIPRTLTVDKSEQPWRSNSSLPLTVSGTNAPPAP